MSTSVEIEAETDPETTVMANGDMAEAVVLAGSRIRHFVGPPPQSVPLVTITAQTIRAAYTRTR